jgi:hypothetical protein
MRIGLGHAVVVLFLSICCSADEYVSQIVLSERGTILEVRVQTDYMDLILNDSGRVTQILLTKVSDPSKISYDVDPTFASNNGTGLTAISRIGNRISSLGKTRLVYNSIDTSIIERIGAVDLAYQPGLNQRGRLKSIGPIMFDYFSQQARLKSIGPAQVEYRPDGIIDFGRSTFASFLAAAGRHIPIIVRLTLKQ